MSEPPADGAAPQLDPLLQLLTSPNSEHLATDHEFRQRVSAELDLLDAQECQRLLVLASQLAENSRDSVALLLSLGLPALARSESPERVDLLSAMEGLADTTPAALAALLNQTNRTQVSLPPQQLARLLTQASTLAPRSLRGAIGLITNANQLYQRLTPSAVERWIGQGEDLLRFSEQEGADYFTFQSRKAMTALRALAAGVGLDEVREVLRLYCEALTGSNINVISTTEGARFQGQWVENEDIKWDAPVILATPVMQAFPTKEVNFEAYKVLVTHQTGHFGFGTYQFTFDHEGAVLPTLRTRVQPPAPDHKHDHEPGQQPEHHPAADSNGFERFFGLFAHQQLARDLFTLAEDFRIDLRIREEYRGIRKPYEVVQHHTAAARPALPRFPLREYFVELLVRRSIQPQESYRVPLGFEDRFLQTLQLLELANRPALGVEDVAETALRLYILLRPVPNFPLEFFPDDQWVEVRPPSEPYDPAQEDADTLIHEFNEVNRAENRPILPPNFGTPQQAELPYRRSESVEHRQEPRPELAQALMESQQHSESDEGDAELDPNATQDLLQQALEEMLDQAQQDRKDEDDQPVSLNPQEGPKGSRSAHFTTPDTRNNQDQSPSVMENVGEGDTKLFYYNEWDYRVGAYRPAWCQVRERTLREGHGEFYQKTMLEYPALVHAVRRQFEMLKPQAMAPVKRLLDGEDFDLDALVESIVDKRSGNGLRDKIYWRRRHIQRSVVVSLLLDMSASTGDRVDEDLRYYYSQDVDETDTEAAKTRSAAIKRIIELEKESLVLLIEALERLSDAYGIYGFSSAGRSDVRFYVVKETNETASPQVRARIDSIVPLQGTRMGPAIRHATAKLEQEPAHTKLLLVLTDGRPQDKDYGQTLWDPLRGRPASLPYEQQLTQDNEYAVHDTKAALNEARAKGITPFCVSIDKEGHDYLKAMCGDIGYEVVDNIEALPRRLPSLYRRLTT